MRCNELMGKNSINSYYEFLFAMSLAAECGRRGFPLDMRDMRIFAKDVLSDDDLAYMRYLKSTGCIFDGTNNTAKPLSFIEMENVKNSKYYFNMEAITNLYDVLVKEEEDYYVWDTAYAYKYYGGYSRDILNKRRICNTIMHLMAHLLISFKLGERVLKPVKFCFRTYEVATMYMYLDLLACSRTIDSLKDLAIIDLDANYTDNIGDIDFNILFNTAIHAKTLKKWSCSEKFEAFKKYGFEKGSIAVLYERGRMSESNPIGSIIRASIIRIDDYVEDLYSGAGWYVTKFSVNKTIEELEEEYYGADEEYRDAFPELLNPSLGRAKSFLSFESVGIGTYFLDEEYIIMPLERDEKVSKKVSIDGKSAVLELDDIEIIYWILNQYGVEFDTEKYKKFYNGGNPLMWDKYDCTPVRRVVNSTPEESDYTDYED